MGATCVLPACFLRASFYTATAGAGLTSTYKLNWTETHTIWSTFLGSMQEAHMGATCVLPSVASLTGRAVYNLVLLSFLLSIRKVQDKLCLVERHFHKELSSLRSIELSPIF